LRRIEKLKKIAFVTYPKAPDLTADDALVIPFLKNRSLELIEPELFLRIDHSTAEKFSDAIWAVLEP
jgi:hypothetical protein